RTSSLVRVSLPSPKDARQLMKSWVAAGHKSDGHWPTAVRRRDKLTGKDPSTPLPLRPAPNLTTNFLHGQFRDCGSDSVLDLVSVALGFSVCWCVDHDLDCQVVGK
ncbi:hypothetical protein BaRGS_00002430, partial [Batillaria attramentaria]